MKMLRTGYVLGYHLCRFVGRLNLWQGFKTIWRYCLVEKHIETLGRLPLRLFHAGRTLE